MKTSDVLAEIAFEVKPAWAKFKRAVECIPHFTVNRDMSLKKSIAPEFFVADITFEETAIGRTIFYVFRSFVLLQITPLFKGLIANIT